MLTFACAAPHAQNGYAVAGSGRPAGPEAGPAGLVCGSSPAGVEMPTDGHSNAGGQGAIARAASSATKHGHREGECTFEGGGGVAEKGTFYIRWTSWNTFASGL